MRAVVVDAFGAPPHVREVPDPTCPPHGVVVDVRATGVCRSDWHAWAGHDDDVRVPYVPGHELAGVVTQVGPDVQGWRGGERVTVPFVCACGTCSACAAGEHQVCERQEQPGFTYDGSFAERVAVPWADVNLVALPDAVSDDAAALLGCRFATAYRAVRTHARVGAGESLVVHGCGGVGLAAVMVGVAGGARVVAVDPSPDARAAAEALGAGAALDPAGMTPDGVASAVVDLTGGGARASIDAVGHPDVARASVLSLARRGRHVQAGLLLGDAAAAPMAMDRVIAWELELYGSHGMAAHDYPAMLAEIASGALDPARLVGAVVGLDDAAGALVAMGGEPEHAGVTIVRP
ncbi:Alcohol dehydrogenase GroES domain protein [Beutenbergia cavernae DSM 12333]|uniref:Alcohol dehydrogenase GroES domain protein n=1 Tax=Beutenbergia cavernae (strain ATCC BAA-8 / DSM 12333 / CCUG 43141 / JCM 11478 / NBRC 16432 / NCIMB 13614 / HKI 0122) TaxID=471853 RepID=C5C3J6_BEUC1|nr:zinc-dependent alcohol dehydrogenase family protein [Beutenbergia cavernae]ACQ81905.1 Alcohol dehydrogenase GroES domain protein [Beutenbergia cavernae DSM 12333]